MATISVGELLVRCLKAEGVELMTGIVDGAHIPILVHTPQYGIRYINAHHVQVDHDLNTRPPGWEQYRKARAVRGY